MTQILIWNLIIAIFQNHCKRALEKKVNFYPLGE